VASGLPVLIDPAKVRFPARCASCGGKPERELMLRSFRGINLLLASWGYACEIPVPMCRGCRQLPLFVRGWQQDRVQLGFRDEKLAQEVAVLSGLQAPQQREANYRESAVAITPPVWRGPRLRGLPWSSALVIGAIFFAVAAGEFVQYSQLERSGESFSDQLIFVWIYELGGKWLLSGILAAMGAALCGVGFFLRKK
jgi:hypothetical protein